MLNLRDISLRTLNPNQFPVKLPSKAPLGHKGSWPEGPEGIRTLQISEHSEIRSKSPPSFADANATSPYRAGHDKGRLYP